MSSGNDCKTLSSIINSVENGIMVLDENLQIHYWNRWLEKQTLITSAQALGKNLEHFAPYIKSKSLKRKISSSLKLDCSTYLHAATSHYLIKIPLKTGVSRVYEFMQQDITIIPLDRDNAQVLLIIYDRTVVSESRLNLENNLRDISILNQNLERYMSVIDANVNVITTNALSEITYVSITLCHLTGYTHQELLHTHVEDFFKNAEGEGFNDMIAAIKEAKSWSGELNNKDKSGKEYWIDISLTPTFTDDEQLYTYNFIFHDITDKKLIEKISTIDSLTGAFNRKKFDESLTLLINTTKRYKPPLSLILFDIDHFKKVNDNYGHVCGDKVLQEISKLIQGSIRKTDIFARWGGEEFVVLLNHTTLENAGLLAEKLCKTIADHSFACIETVTASFGVAQFDEESTKLDFLSSCDKALYASKDNGRNQVTLSHMPTDTSKV